MAAIGLPNETFMPVFEEMLDWQMSVVRRYPNASFAVLVAEPKFLSLHPAVSPQRTAELREFSGLLRQTIRASDLTAYGHLNEVWLMLPHSDGAGSVARLRAAFASLQGLRLQCAFVNVAHGRAMPASAYELIESLRAEMR